MRKRTSSGLNRKHGEGRKDESRDVGKATGYAEHVLCAQHSARVHTHDHFHSPASATVPFRDGERGC